MSVPGRGRYLVNLFPQYTYPLDTSFCVYLPPKYTSSPGYTYPPGYLSPGYNYPLGIPTPRIPTLPWIPTPPGIPTPWDTYPSDTYPRPTSLAGGKNITLWNKCESQQKGIYRKHRLQKNRFFTIFDPKRKEKKEFSL